MFTWSRVVELMISPRVPKNVTQKMSQNVTQNKIIRDNFNAPTKKGFCVGKKREKKKRRKERRKNYLFWFLFLWDQISPCPTHCYRRVGQCSELPCIRWMRPRYERRPKLYCPDVIEFHCGLMKEFCCFGVSQAKTLKYNEIIIKKLYFISFLVEVSGLWLRKNTSINNKSLQCFKTQQRARNRHYSISARTHSDG